MVNCQLKAVTSDRAVRNCHIRDMQKFGTKMKGTMQR
jgi:hypothetical protein